MKLTEIMEDYLQETNNYVERNIQPGWIEGAPGVGKSVQLIKEAVKNRGLYVNLRDPEIAGWNAKRLADEIERVREGSIKVYLDNADKWEDPASVEWISERPNYEVKGAGVNLTGIRVGPKQELGGFTADELIKSEEGYIQRGKAKKVIDRMLSYGTLPEAYLKESRMVALRTIERAYYREIVPIKRPNSESIYQLYMDLIKGEGINETSYSKLAQEYELTTHTVIEYMDLFERSKVISRVREYNNSHRFKVYSFDVGMIDREQYSLKLENLIYLHLRKIDDEIFSYRTKNGKEIDFYSKKIGLVEVTKDVDPDHLSKIVKAAKELRIKEAMIINESEDKLIEEGSIKIQLLPIWRLGEIGCVIHP